MCVRVRLEFWQNAHVRAMCVRPKIECANVRACEAQNRRNSQFGLFEFVRTITVVLFSNTNPVLILNNKKQQHRKNFAKRNH